MSSRLLVYTALLFMLTGLFVPAGVAGAEPGPTEAAVRNLWQGMYKARFVERPDVCEFDYGPNGMRNIYCYANSSVSPADLVALAGKAPFLEGPHTAGELNLTSRFSFGHYNPDFVSWMAQNLIPGRDDENFRWAAQPIYDRFFKNTARVYWLTRLRTQSEADFLEGEAKNLVEGMKNKTLDRYWAYQYHDYLGKDVFPLFLDYNLYYYNVISAAVAFWIRHHVDGTGDEFATGLENLLKTYDTKFLASAQSTGSEPPEDESEIQIRFEPADSMMTRFLTDLARGIETHDWDLVLTFFDPENFKAQIDMGIKPPQYIEEGLGLGMVDNHLIPQPGDSTPFANLNGITSVTFDSMEVPEESGTALITGTATLFDGSARQMTLHLRKTATGAWVMEPALG